MNVKLHRQFIADLVELGNPHAARILKKVFDGAGRFIERAKGEHRYKGIANAWIRYVSQGGHALRAIYIRDGDNVTLYRAGTHSVEDNLTGPTYAEGGDVIDPEIADAMIAGPGNRSGDLERALQRPLVQQEEPVGGQASQLLYNHMDRFLYGNLLGRRFLPHKEVYLVSPFLSVDLLRSTDPFGQMLDELVDSGASIYLVTRPPRRKADLPYFEALAARRLNVFFSSALHAKIYAFILNRDELKPQQRDARNFVAVGSANLTEPGINPRSLRQKDIQFELSYETALDEWPNIETFILHVAGLGIDLDVLRQNLLT